jgi:hypothetical protein
MDFDFLEGMDNDMNEIDLFSLKGGDVELPADEVELPADEVELPADEVELPADEVELPADEVDNLDLADNVAEGEVELPAEVEAEAVAVAEASTKATVSGLENINLLEKLTSVHEDTFKATEIFLEKTTSDEYLNYKRDLDIHYNLLKKGKPSPYLITPPKYDSIKTIQHQIDVELENMEYELKRVRNTLAETPSAALNKQLQTMSEKYEKLIGNKKIFAQYYNIVNNTTDASSLKKKSNSRFDQKSLYSEIRVNPAEARDKIETYLNNNKIIQDIDSTARSLYERDEIDSVILTLPIVKTHTVGKKKLLKKRVKKVDKEKVLVEVLKSIETAEEPTAEEPVKEEPVKEEPTAEEPVKEEPTAEEPVKEEPVKEEPVKEEPVKEEPVKEEPVKEEPVKEPVVENQEGGTSKNIFIEDLDLGDDLDGFAPMEDNYEMEENQNFNETYTNTNTNKLDDEIDTKIPLNFTGGGGGGPTKNEMVVNVIKLGQ